MQLVLDDGRDLVAEETDRLESWLYQFSGSWLTMILDGI